jgi:hypothetical protein
VFQEQVSGIGFKIIIQISIFNLEKDWRFLGKNDFLNKHAIPYIPTWKTYTHNTNMHKITFGIQMKQEFMWNVNLVLGFWPSEVHGLFIALSLSFRNG